jgi:uncharacterized protein (DUF2147 family)
MLAGVLMASVTGTPPAAATGTAEVSGVWATEPRDNGAYITVRISPCREDAAMRCGVIVGAHAGARPDIVGETILRGLEQQEDGSWAGGEIIRPGKGTAYRSALKRVEEGLEVTGCGVGGLVCRSQLWSPAP